MRALGIGFGIVALVVSGGAAAQGKEAKPARRVQLITMTAPGPESRPDAAADPPSVPNPVSTGARPPDFRSDGRRVGHECVRTCRSRWSRSLSKKKLINIHHEV